MTDTEAAVGETHVVEDTMEMTGCGSCRPRHRCRDGKAAKPVQQEEILSGNLALPAADYYVYSKYEETFWITQCIIPSYQLVVFQLLTTSFNFLDVCIAPVWHEENTLLLISCGYLQRE
ncbi:unnamed protein product [Eretmochelys imbricata]